MSSQHVVSVKPTSTASILFPSKPSRSSGISTPSEEPCKGKASTPATSSTGASSGTATEGTPSSLPPYVLSEDDVAKLDTGKIDRPTEKSLKAFDDVDLRQDIAEVVFSRLPEPVLDILEDKIKDQALTVLLDLVEAGTESEVISVIQAPGLLLGMAKYVQKIKAFQTAPLLQLLLVMETFKAIVTFVYSGNVPLDLAVQISYFYPAYVLAFLYTMIPGAKPVDPVTNLANAFQALTKAKSKRTRLRKSTEELPVGRSRKSRSLPPQSKRKGKRNDDDDDADLSDDEEDDEKPKPPKRSASTRRRRYAKWRQDKEDNVKSGCCRRS